MNQVKGDDLAYQTQYGYGIQNPYQMPQAQYQQPQYQSPAQQPVNGIVRVTGMDGAKAYQLPPNSAMPLFDSGGEILFIKTTDGAGFPTILPFRYTQLESQQPNANDYVTRQEFEELKGMVIGAQQPVPAV